MGGGWSGVNLVTQALTFCILLFFLVMRVQTVRGQWFTKHWAAKMAIP